MSFTCGVGRQYEYGRVNEAGGHLVIAINHEVLVFDVAMGDALAVEVVYSLDDLREDVACVRL